MRTQDDLTDQTRANAEADTALSRRSFLGGMGGAAAAAAVGAVALEPLVRATPARAVELGPAIGFSRLDAAYQSRLDRAARMYAEGSPAHPSNGDEAAYGSRIASYSKGLPHDAIGQVVPAAYDAMRAALASGNPADFEAIPLGGARRLTNPQAGLAFDTEGNDPHQFVLAPPPRFASAEEAGEEVELYWMALLRDTRFTDYDRSVLARRAVAELSSLSDFQYEVCSIGSAAPSGVAENFC